MLPSPSKYPFGRAPFWLLIVAICSSALLLALRPTKSARADLVLTVFAGSHLDAYKQALPAFERKHQVSVRTQLVDWRALEARLQSSILSGTDIPDVIELAEGSLGFFAQGPADEVGFLELSDFLKREGLEDRLVESRLSPWTVNGNLYALPHDVHPVTLVYRADIVEGELGIDVSTLDTWDSFVEMGRKVTGDLDGDGTIDRYAIDLPSEGSHGLALLMLQRGGQFFDEKGNVAFDSEKTRKTLSWYIRQTRGPQRIAFDAGFGQTVGKALSDGLVLFFLTPDWRSRAFERDVPNLEGRLKMMPLPAWLPGERRTSVWGGTGLVINKRSKNLRFAQELAKTLYFDEKALGDRFLATNIVPPLESAWDSPVFDTKNAYYSGQRIGRIYADLARETPPVHSALTLRSAQRAVDQVLARAAKHFDDHGVKGLDELIASELSRSAAHVENLARRHRRLQEGPRP